MDCRKDIHTHPSTYQPLTAQDRFASEMQLEQHVVENCMIERLYICTEITVGTEQTLIH